jgi:serine protease Do
MVGEPVIAIGNPFGLSNSVTTGVLSAVDRSIRTEDRVYHGFLQTDASINPGNSGGPLLNAEGRLVGINTAIYGGGAQGIGFAIPIDAAKRVMAELIAHGSVTPVSLGIEVQDLDARLGEALSLPRGASGALVSQVRAGGPGAAAGVRRGDLVTRLDGMTVRSARDFYEVLEHVTVGQAVRVELLQGGAPRSLTAVARELAPGAVAELAEQLLGLRLENRPRAGFVVVSVRPGSGSARIGVAAGDRVLAINGRVLESDEALQRAVLGLRGLPRAVLVVQRGNGRYHVPIPLS